ncbi:MAG TPA: hypothetical protein VJB88_03875, partial [Vicinamibacteria bacterium]|nr:hypothetical protein [Vicinamibacteria bacterium]
MRVSPQSLGNIALGVRIALPATVLLLVPLPASALQEEQPGGKVILAASVPEPPVVDGDLTETVWDQATPVTDFLQQEPTEGGSPSEKTEVRIL